MSYGKEMFRGKYKETMDSLNIIKENYYDLDQEYQIISKQLQQKENIIKEVKEYCLGKAKGRLERTLYDDILEILDKENI